MDGMPMNTRTLSFLRIVAPALLALFCGLLARAQTPPGSLTVHVDQPGAAISPTLYGLMTEEINHSYDGGLYAELIQNRVFQDDASSPVHWSLVQSGGGTGSISLDTGQAVNSALTTSLKLTVTNPGTRVGAANDGYWGIPVTPATTYRASFYAKASSGFAGPLTVDIETQDGATVFAKAQTPVIDTTWRKYSLTLQTGLATPGAANRFVVSAKSSGTVWLNLVSLFPPTFNDRPNGNRIDLMQKLGAMHPAFLRFPGGNYLDPGHYQWKTTLGPVDQRAGHEGAWGYRSSDGLGILEFLEWCEDLGMEPLLAVSDGRGWLAASGDVTPLVQDALDEIEYVTGDQTTTWGAKRAADGHPAPFVLHYVEIGNEDFFDDLSTYNARFAAFYDAIRAKYPQLQIIATRGDVSSRVPDLLDDHYYRSAAANAADAHHYDGYSRTGPKIMVGEWASTEGSPTPTMNAALGDAAWLTGLERNSDLVKLSCYAPLLVNVNSGASQWGTNLIGYDAMGSYGSPSYYVQSMFYANRGNVVLPVDISPQPAPSANSPTGAIGVGTWSTQARFRNVKVTHGDTVLYQTDFSNGATDWTTSQGTWQVTNGVLQQTGGSTDCRDTVGDPTWTDYTYSLQALKTGGSEGFLIMFHVKDHDNFVWWNIGGWGNTRTALERATGGSKTQIGASSSIAVQSNRWYDISIVVQGTSIKCYLDGALVTQATDSTDGVDPVYATASRDLESGDVILKAVNFTSADQQLQVSLQGAAGVAGKGTLTVLRGQPTDVNTLSSPRKVAAQSASLSGAGQSFLHTFPAYSVSVIRVKARLGGAYTLAEAVSAARIAAGLQIAAAADVTRLDAASEGYVDMLDALLVARSAAGLDP
jgi:alpha-L-arabinofuranosidase